VFVDVCRAQIFIQVTELSLPSIVVKSINLFLYGHGGVTNFYPEAIFWQLEQQTQCLGLSFHKRNEEKSSCLALVNIEISQESGNLLCCL